MAIGGLKRLGWEGGRGNEGGASEGGGFLLVKVGKYKTTRIAKC